MRTSDTPITIQRFSKLSETLSASQYRTRSILSYTTEPQYISSKKGLYML
jgi:hypothetical protein